MRCKYREKIYRCGDYLEADIFPVFAKAQGRRKAKYKPTSEMQARLNQRNAERYLTRLLNLNFTEDDISVTLTYSDSYLPETLEEAEKDVYNFLRRLKRLRAKSGLPEIVYVKIAGPGRFHFHIPMSGGVDDKAIQKLWPYGYANIIHFEFNENGIEGHARYIAKQFEGSDDIDIFSMFDINEETGEVSEKSDAGRSKGKRRYSCSRNIKRPVAEEHDGRISQAKAEELATVDSGSRAAFEKMYPGYYLADCKPYYNTENGGYYLHVRMYRADAEFLKTRSKYKPRRKALPGYMRFEAKAFPGYLNVKTTEEENE